MPTRRNETVRLRPADPFDLIRWLARSQSDPRKAVAELVQNSLDAGATHVRLARRRHRGVTVLTLHDDGEGVIPELSREEALRFLATHIGHSRKRQLTPQERARQVIAGQYGVGLLGFWSIGRHLELRSRVEGSELWSLKLEEDRAQGAIGRIATPIGAPRTYTELVVSGVHAAAQRLVGGRKLADYLGSELRGQLLAREVVLEVHDASARGLAQKDFRVVPRRFEGERLSLPEEIDVPGHPPARLELYLAPTAELAGVQVACRGTLVADDVRELGTLGLDGPPWVGRQLRGLVDFSGFEVPPGTRRGVRPDRAALAFAEALQSLAPAVEAELARLDRERTVASDRETARQLRRALRGFHRRFPQYELPEVDHGREGDGERHGEQPGVPPAPEPPVEPAPVLELFPPGPPVTVEIVPALVEVPVGGERRVQAVSRDSEGRVSRSAECRWTVNGRGFSLVGLGFRPAIAAEATLSLGAEGELGVEVGAASAEATLRAVAPVEPESGTRGLPEPRLVSDPGGLWRSRMQGQTWEVNDAHEDYVALRGEARARFRYLLTLLAKELVHGSYPAPGSEELLERMAEVLAHAERNLRGG